MRSKNKLVSTKYLMFYAFAFLRSWIMHIPPGLSRRHCPNLDKRFGLSAFNTCVFVVPDVCLLTVVSIILSFIDFKRKCSDYFFIKKQFLAKGIRNKEKSKVCRTKRLLKTRPGFPATVIKQPSSILLNIFYFFRFNV